jgi:tetratricopeptide (TPR) repeat protein
VPEIRRNSRDTAQHGADSIGIGLGASCGKEIFMQTRNVPAPSDNLFSAMNAVTGIAGVLFGIIVGYIIGSGQFQNAAVSAAGALPAPTAGSAPTLVAEADLRPYRDILANDPKNARAAEALGNKLYDAGRYGEAVPYYQQSLVNDPKNVNVSTDLGTALFYAGRADEALVQLQKSLALDARHAQTLFNIGIVKRDGKNDRKGAVEAWERLLATNPGYADASKVQALIAETK